MKTQAKSQASHQQVKVKLLLIEDNRLLREGLKALLDEQADMEVLAAVANWETALPKIRQLKPQVVLLDNLQGKATVRALEEISKEAPEVRIIVMDLVPERAELVEFIDAGASGFLIKDAQLHDFLATVRTVAEGGKVLPSDLTGSLFSEIVERVVTAGKTHLFRAVRISRREREVMQLVAEGLSNNEIAQKLHISTYTVKTHVHNLLEKLALHSRL